MKRRKNSNVLKDWQCPYCGSLEPFDIRARATFEGVTDEGTEFYTNVEWDSLSWVRCCSCGNTGTAGEFSHEEPA